MKRQAVLLGTALAMGTAHPLPADGTLPPFSEYLLVEVK